MFRNRVRSRDTETESHDARSCITHANSQNSHRRNGYWSPERQGHRGQSRGRWWRCDRWKIACAISPGSSRSGHLHRLQEDVPGPEIDAVFVGTPTSGMCPSLWRRSKRQARPGHKPLADCEEAARELVRPPGRRCRQYDVPLDVSRRGDLQETIQAASSVRSITHAPVRRGGIPGGTLLYQRAAPALRWASTCSTLLGG